VAINVLIVDDSLTIRMVVKRVLAQTDLMIGEVYDAGDGAEALEVVAAHPVDLILSDINMPNIDGLELVRRLAADPATASIAVIMITTEGAESTLEEALSVGAKGYVTKPFTPEDLAEAIEKCDLSS
jgi:two-component system chemotaxis response regulator CheY